MIFSANRHPPAMETDEVKAIETDQTRLMPWRRVSEAHLVLLPITHVLSQFLLYNVWATMYLVQLDLTLHRRYKVNSN